MGHYRVNNKHFFPCSLEGLPMRSDDMDTLANMKLGKRAPRRDRRTLQLANYLRLGALPVLPAQQDWSVKVTFWGMMEKDSRNEFLAKVAEYLQEDNMLLNTDHYLDLNDGVFDAT